MRQREKGREREREREKKKKCTLNSALIFTLFFTFTRFFEHFVTSNCFSSLSLSLFVFIFIFLSGNNCVEAKKLVIHGTFIEKKKEETIFNSDKRNAWIIPQSRKVHSSPIHFSSFLSPSLTLFLLLSFQRPSLMREYPELVNVKQMYKFRILLFISLYFSSLSLSLSFLCPTKCFFSLFF